MKLHFQMAFSLSHMLWVEIGLKISVRFSLNWHVHDYNEVLLETDESKDTLV